MRTIASVETDNLDTVIPILTIVFGVGVAWATSKVMLSAHDKQLAELKKVDEKSATEAKDAETKRAEAARMLETRVAAVEKDFADLSRRHNEAAMEMRNRAAALEGRASTLERDGVELRGELRALTQTTARIEAKQDQAHAGQEQLRSDVLRAIADLVSSGRKTKSRTS